MSHVTTHILDLGRGEPASGVVVKLARKSGAGGWSNIGAATTDGDGRAEGFSPESLDEDTYRLTFETESYFQSLGVESFYPQVEVIFRVTDPTQHYHVPLLLSAFGYTTYRGG